MSNDGITYICDITVPNTDRTLIIEFVNVNVVNELKDDRFNSNNHWNYTIDSSNSLIKIDNHIKPDNYNDIMKKTQTNMWIDKFHKNYYVINIDPKYYDWLKKISQLGFHINYRISNLYKEDLKDLANEYKDCLVEGKKYFVRTENVSLKTGIHGPGPYQDMLSILESTITCDISHTPLSFIKNHFNNILKYYLLEWKDIDPMKEFRVFIKDRKIIAISQQHLYETNTLLNSMNTKEIIETITKWTNIILDYTNNVVLTKIDHIDSFTMDICLLDKPYFIEINSYGYNLSAGSSLFHWIHDQRVFMENHNNIYFRVCI